MTTTPLPLRLLGNTGKTALVMLIVGAVAAAWCLMIYGMAKLAGTWLVVAFFALALAIGVAVTWAERRKAQPKRRLSAEEVEAAKHEAVRQFVDGVFGDDA